MEEKPEDHKDNWVDWDVRCEYEMLMSSVNRDKPSSFVLFYKVYTYDTQTAWELALKAFPMKFVFDGKVYGRETMRVSIEG